MFAALLPTLAAIAVLALGIWAQDPIGPAPALARETTLPAPPPYDPAERTAVIVAGNSATEVSDFLAPYEALAASDAFNVYVVAPEWHPSPLLPILVDQPPLGDRDWSLPLLACPVLLGALGVLIVRGSGRLQQIHPHTTGAVAARRPA